MNNPLNSGDQEFVIVQLLHHHRSHLGEYSKLRALQDLVYDGYQLRNMATVKLHGTNFGVDIPSQRVMVIFGMNLKRVNGSSGNNSDFYFIEENI